MKIIKVTPRRTLEVTGLVANQVQQLAFENLLRAFGKLLVRDGRTEFSLKDFAEIVSAKARELKLSEGVELSSVNLLALLHEQTIEGLPEEGVA